jgi:phospholipase C
MPPIMMQSDDPATDALLGQGTGSGLCGKPSLQQYKDRCGYGPRLPLLVISPYAKSNFVDHQVTDHTSILRFIEENWNLKQIGDQSFDQWAGSINSMFNFTAPQYRNLVLDPSTGK